MCETCCVSGRHAKNMLNIKISRHPLVYYYLWNLSLGLNIAEYPSTNLHKNSVHCILTRSSKNAVLAKFHENPSNLYKFAQSGCIPPEIICEIFACKGS